MAKLALVNGKVVTVDEQFSVVSAVAIDSDRITATGTDAEILASAGGDGDSGGSSTVHSRACQRADLGIPGPRVNQESCVHAHSLAETQPGPG